MNCYSFLFVCPSRCNFILLLSVCSAVLSGEEDYLAQGKHQKNPNASLNISIQIVTVTLVIQSSPSFFMSVWHVNYTDMSSFSHISFENFHLLKDLHRCDNWMAITCVQKTTRELQEKSWIPWMPYIFVVVQFHESLEVTSEKGAIFGPDISSLVYVFCENMTPIFVCFPTKSSSI